MTIRSKDKRDVFYRKAKELGFRARSAFKLLQINEKFNILEGRRKRPHPFRSHIVMRIALCIVGVTRAVDLCSAPGGWSQVLSLKMGLTREDGSAAKDLDAQEKKQIVAVDLQKMRPIPGVHFIEGDITRLSTARETVSYFGGHLADLVVCDGAPDIICVHDFDEYLQNQLVLMALNITTHLLTRGGSFIAKLFRGKDVVTMYAMLQLFFDRVFLSKPKACRNSSVEGFVVCLGYRPPSDFTPSMDRPLLTSQFIHPPSVEEKNEKCPSAEYGDAMHSPVPFVSCGLTRLDPDQSYALSEGIIEAHDISLYGATRSDDYQCHQPHAPPINPPYKKSLDLKRSNQLHNRFSFAAGPKSNET